MHARNALTRGKRFAMALTAVVALSSTAVSGCSGDGDGRLSKQQFIDRAGEICAAANRKIRAIGDPDLTDPEATTGAIRRLLGIQRRELADLRALEPPESDKPAIRKWLTSVARALRDADAALAALERGDRQGVNNANARGVEAQLAADDMARDYGVNGCTSQEEAPPPATSGA